MLVRSRSNLGRLGNIRDEICQCVSRSKEACVCRNILSLRLGNPVYILGLRIWRAWVEDTKLNSRDGVSRSRAG